MRVSIEKLIYGGDGLARLAPDESGRRKTLFAPFTINGEEVDVRITEDRSSFARGSVNELLKSSPHRIAPPCPYFFRCGGCQYQHIDYSHQLATKAAILRETVGRIAKVDLPDPIHVHAFEPWNYRNRTRMHVQSSPQFAIGYHRANSNQLLPVEVCPISSPLINRALAATWQAGREGLIPFSVQEIQFFVDDSDSNLLLEFFADAKEPGTYAGSWSALSEKLPELRGLVVFATAPSDAQDSRAPLAVTGSRRLESFGEPALSYSAGGQSYRVSGGSFFQTNRFAVEALLNVVTANRTGRQALDLYCGAGLFTLPLAKNFRNLTAVESSPSSFTDLTQNASPNVSKVRQSVDEFLRKSRNLSADYVVVDPPRAGLGDRVSQMLGRVNTPCVTYVSCEPSTLSRDLKTLLQSGFRIEKAHLVDLFPQTFHMESVIELTR